ncbi:MAG: hypothetical protein IJA93_02395, partial [Clostridia bacterium]|nr:hypothetical protein [Clostridia bacterium]
IKTTGLAGGLIRPFKGLVLAKRLKAHRAMLPDRRGSKYQAPRQGVFSFEFSFAFFSLSLKPLIPIEIRGLLTV